MACWLGCGWRSPTRSCSRCFAPPRPKRRTAAARSRPPGRTWWPPCAAAAWRPRNTTPCSWASAGDHAAACNLEQQQLFFRAQLQPWVEARAALWSAVAEVTRRFVQVETQAFDLLEGGEPR